MNLRDAIRLAAANDEIQYCQFAKVTAIDNDANTIDCEPLDGSAELIEVRLQAQQGKGVVFYPKVGSVVVVSFFSKDDAYVSMVSDVDLVVIESQQESLLKILQDLIEQVANLKVTTNQGPSIEVINKAQIEAIGNRLPNLFAK